MRKQPDKDGHAVKDLWTCELFFFNVELIKTKTYKASFQRIQQKNSTEGKGNEYNETVKTITTKRIVGITSYINPSLLYSFHIKVKIIDCDAKNTNQSTIGTPKQQLVKSTCWFGAAKSLIDSSELSDFTFIVQGKEFKVHKLILSLASAIFRGTFECKLEEPWENFAKLHDCDPEMFQNLLNFIYKGIVPVNIQEIALDLFKLARTYQIVSLLKSCTKKSMKTMLSTCTKLQSPMTSKSSRMNAGILSKCENSKMFYNAETIINIYLQQNDESRYTVGRRTLYCRRNS